MFRWIFGVASTLAVLLLVGILSIDFIARKIVEKRLKEKTGLETRIEKFSIGLSTATIKIQNLVMKNSAAFGGDNFLEMPELFLGYDRAALRSGKLHLKIVRINLALIHVVENERGRRNVDSLPGNEMKSVSGQRKNFGTSGGDLPFAFDGIDLLEVTLRVVEFTSAKNPELNVKQDLGIQNERFHHLKTESDFQTVAAVIALKSGFNFWLSGGDFNPSTLFLKSNSKKKKQPKVLRENPLSSLPDPITPMEPK